MINKVVFITGSCRGIGLEIARKFAQEGYDVALNYSSPSGEARAKSVVENLIEKGKSKGHEVKIKAYVGSVASSAEVDSMIKAILADFSKIDILINSAGITVDGISFRTTDEAWDKVINTNLTGTFRVCRAVIPSMMKNRVGNIINLSSIVGIHGNMGQANYSASKAGIIGLTKTLAKELSSRGILVNAIAPGAVDTDMFNSLNDGIKESIIKTIPLGRAAKASEIADLAFYLGNQSYITGQVIKIDGGMGI